MRKIYQLLLLVVLGGSTALSSCTRATYTFQPNTVTYRGDAAQATKRPVVVAPAESTAPIQAEVSPSPVVVSSAPVVVTSHPKGPGHSEKPKRIASVLAAQRLVASTVLTRAVKMLGPQQNTAEQAQPHSKAKTFLLRAGGVLMAVGIILFLATVAANPGLETGVILVSIAVLGFAAGLAMLVTGLFQKG